MEHSRRSHASSRLQRLLQLVDDDLHRSERKKCRPSECGQARLPVLSLLSHKCTATSLSLSRYLSWSSFEKKTSVCDMCVFRRDHHCSFGAVCVGHFNQRYFMASILNLLPLMAALTKWVLFNLQYYYEFHFQSDLGLHLDQNGWPVHSRQDLAAVPSSSSPRCQVISSPIQRSVCQYKC